MNHYYTASAILFLLGVLFFTVSYFKETRLDEKRKDFLFTMVALVCFLYSVWRLL